ncbi:MAG: type III-B CRISPR module RAMP protein Cmr1 [Anaerolineales bacterium]
MKTRDPKKVFENIEKAPDVKPNYDGYITETRKYKLITPLFGGGVKAQEADLITVIRGTSVRGQLRFWWRATRGGQFDSALEKMKIREDEIWGSTQSESQVVISVDITKPGNEEVAFWVISSTKQDKNGRTVTKPETVASPKIASYAAFPLMPDKNECKQVGWVSKKVLLDVEFSVVLTYPSKYQEDVNAALWAWETFGGIGARTRRGFGALSRTDNNGTIPLAKDVNKWIGDQAAKYVVFNGVWAKGVPHLGCRDIFFITTSRTQDGITAWKNLIGLFQRFRQQDARVDKRTGRPKDQGLSQWPEANAIRKELGYEAKVAINVSKSSLIPKYPRAAFGLPIIFHMAHDKEIKGDLTLQGIDKYDRLASSLILRPLACADGNVGLAVILQWDRVNSDEPYTPPGGLRLIGKDDGVDKLVQSQISANEIANIPLLKNKKNILQAFFTYLTEKESR